MLCLNDTGFAESGSGRSSGCVSVYREDSCTPVKPRRCKGAMVFSARVGFCADGLENGS